MSRSESISQHYVTVERTARFVTMGTPSERLREVWFVCHGYGELASSFIRGLSVLDDGTRLIVAPEALARFYLDTPHRKVGASWMTCEDRLNEIRDYLAYLDAVHAEVFSRIDRASVRVMVLGFSQGAATAARWACRGAVQTEQLIIWGETLPPELEDRESLRRLRSMQLTVVGGTRDHFFTKLRRAELRKHLTRLDVPFEELGFNGGHRLDDATLLAIAGRGD
jgi:predicted esterase